MDKIIAALKSKTFYGGLAFAIIKYLETAQIITPELSNILQPLMVALGLYGARNSEKKVTFAQNDIEYKPVDPEKTEFKIGPSIKVNK